MKTLKPLAIVASILISQISFAGNEEGEKLYKENCAVCHGSTGGMDVTKRIAPPIAAVRMHYIGTHKDQASFVSAVSSWVEKQDPKKSLMRGAIKKFNIMPPLTVAKEDAQKIAAYIYSGNIEEIEGFKEHVKKEHGKKGMKQDKGMHPDKEGKQHSEAGKNKEKHSKMKNMMQKLGITPEQKESIKPLMMQRQEIMMPLKKEMRQIKQAIEQLDSTDPDYKNSIFALAKKKGDLVHRIVIEKGELRMKLDAVLTAEQRIKLKELKMTKKKNSH